MPARLSKPGIAVAAALGSLTLRMYSRTGDVAQNAGGLYDLAVSFAAIWIGSYVVGCLYFIFIYPFYISPLRNLPTLPNPHWLLGHMPQMMKTPPGATSRKWCVYMRMGLCQESNNKNAKKNLLQESCPKA